MSLIFVDVEATKGSPWSGVMTEFGAVEFTTRETFHGILHAAHPDPTNPAVPILDDVESKAKEHVVAVNVMATFDLWLQDNSEGRPVFVSDNPAHDFQWINFYFDKYLNRNPFGHSGRRISDFYAGLNTDWRNTQGWKKFRVTPHDHNPVNDAMGNVEAFERIIEQFGVPL